MSIMQEGLHADCVNLSAADIDQHYPQGYAFRCESHEHEVAVPGGLCLQRKTQLLLSDQVLRLPRLRCCCSEDQNRSV